MSFLCAYGQSLHDVTLDLNVGGEVYDVTYDDTRDLYIVVGDFTVIQGQARKNLAFIDANTMQVTSNNPISSMDGYITSVEYVKVINSSGGFSFVNHYLYIGGNFSSINGQAKKVMARLKASTISNYSLDGSWTAPFESFSSSISDFEMAGDTIVAIGNIFYPHNFETREQIIAFDASSNSLAFLPGINFDLSSVGASNLWHLKFFDNYFYLDGLYRFDINGNYIAQLNVCNANTCNSGLFGLHYDFGIHESSHDTIMMGLRISGQTTPLGGTATVCTNPMYYNYFGFPLNCIPNLVISTEVGPRVESYNDNVFSFDGSSISVTERTPSLYNESFSPYMSIGTNMSVNFLSLGPTNDNMNFADYRQKMKVVRNRLFVSDASLEYIYFSGMQRQGLAVFCLEPIDVFGFSDFDSTICYGDTVKYTIPQSQYAEGYRWTYTGAGAAYRVANSGDPFQSLSSVQITSETANSIEVFYPTGSMSGVLTAQPFSTCPIINNNTDYLYAKEVTLNIQVTPIPEVDILEESMSFTCITDTFDVVVQSSTIGMSWEWQYDSDATVLSTSNTMPVGMNSAPTEQNGSYYYVTGTEPINGCVGVDSVMILIDNTPAIPDPASNVQVPSVFNCATDSVYMTNTTPDATISWILNSDPNNELTDFVIYNGDDSLNITCLITYNSNGCQTQLSYEIDVDAETLDAQVIGYTDLLTDTLDCNNPNLSLECALNPSSANGTVDWIINGAAAGSTLNLSIADTAGMTNGAQTYTYTSTNLDNGCTADFSAVVSFDFEEPFVVPYNGPSSINCSASDLELIHDLSGGNVQEGWLDASGVNTNNNSLFVNTIGSYVYEVLSLDNGCSVQDTTEILLTTELLLDLQEDILLCDGQTGSITATPINNTETTTYTWSNGQAGQTIDVLGGTDVLVSVIAENSSGCIGYDTITVNTASAIQAVLEASSGCTGGAVQVLSVSGGTGSYSYSMDALTWQQDPVFSELPFGDQTIYIQDDLGCVYSFMATIDENTASFDMNFLASTYNAQGDTIAIVNVSNYTGFDSIGWVLPVGAIVHSIDDSMVVMSMDAAGWYDVTMLGYQDTCSYSFTNPVYFGDYTPVFDENYEQLGITSVNIYPIPISGSSTFTVDLTLGTSQNYVVVVTNYLGQPIPGMSQSGVGQSMSLDFTLPGVSPGNYLVHIIADYDAQQQTIVVQ